MPRSRRRKIAKPQPQTPWARPALRGVMGSQARMKEAKAQRALAAALRAEAEARAARLLNGLEGAPVEASIDATVEPQLEVEAALHDGTVRYAPDNQEIAVADALRFLQTSTTGVVRLSPLLFGTHVERVFLAAALEQGYTVQKNTRGLFITVPPAAPAVPPVPPTTEET